MSSTKLFDDKWNNANSVETSVGIINIFNSDCRHVNDCSIFTITSDATLSFEETEKILLKAISSNPEKFNDQKVAIYVFASFKDSELEGILIGDYYEFKGCFEFINAQRGWTLLKYSRATRLPLSDCE